MAAHRNIGLCVMLIQCFYLAMATNANSAPRHLFITFDYHFNPGGPNSSNAIAFREIIIDNNRIFVQDSMLGGLSASTSEHQTAVAVDIPAEINKWKCKEYTHNNPQDEPSTQLLGMQFRLCVRIISYNNNNLILDYTTDAKMQYDSIEQTRLSINLSETTCNAQAISSQFFAAGPNKTIREFITMQVQRCIYPTHCTAIPGQGRVCN